MSAMGARSIRTLRPFPFAATALSPSGVIAAGELALGCTVLPARLTTMPDHNESVSALRLSPRAGSVGLASGLEHSPTLVTGCGI